MFIADGRKAAIARKGAQSVHTALKGSTAIGGMAVGLVGMTPLVPDWMFAYERFCHILTDNAGHLSNWNHAVAFTSATGGMVGVVLAIHKFFAAILENPASRWYFIFAMMSLGVVTANPIASLLEKSNLIGGGIGASSTTDAMAVTAVLVQSALFPVCAVIGTLCFGVFAKNFALWRIARQAKQDATRQITGLKQMLRAETEADRTADELDRLEATMKREFRRLMHGAAMALAQDYELYLKGKAPAPNRATINQQIDAIFETANSGQKELRDQVIDHMPEFLPIESLPQDGSRLPKAAQNKIRAYVRWIKKEFARSALRAAI